MKKEFIFQKVLGVVFILCGIIPFVVLSTVAFTGYGTFPVYLRTTFVALLHGNFPASVWTIVGCFYWVSIFVGVVIVIFGTLLCIKKDNPIFKKNLVGLPIVIGLSTFYIVAFVINVFMISRNFASTAFYIYTTSKLLTTTNLILICILAQKSNKKSKKQENSLERE